MRKLKLPPALIGETWPMLLERHEREKYLLLRRALELHGWRQTPAVEMVGTTRAVLARVLRRHEDLGRMVRKHNSPGRPREPRGQQTLHKPLVTLPVGLEDVSWPVLMQRQEHEKYLLVGHALQLHGWSPTPAASMLETTSAVLRRVFDRYEDLAAEVAKHNRGRGRPPKTPRQSRRTPAS